MTLVANVGQAASRELRERAAAIRPGAEARGPEPEHRVARTSGWPARAQIRGPVHPVAIRALATACASDRRLVSGRPRAGDVSESVARSRDGGFLLVGQDWGGFRGKVTSQLLGPPRIEEFRVLLHECAEGRVQLSL